MPLTSRRLRLVLRWAHIILGLVILCYIYSPFQKYAAFRAAVKWLAVPLLTLSGVWIWKFSRINRFLGIR